MNQAYFHLPKTTRDLPMEIGVFKVLMHNILLVLESYLRCSVN